MCCAVSVASLIVFFRYLYRFANRFCLFFLQKKAAAPAPAAAAAAAAPAAKAAAPAAAAPAANGKAAAAPAAANGKAAAAAPAGPPKDPNDPKVKAEEVHDVYVCVAIVSSLSLSHSLYIVCPSTCCSYR